MNLLKNQYFLLTILLVAVAGYKFVYKKRTVEMPKYGEYLSCHGKTNDVKVKVKSDLYLLEEALPKDPEELKWFYISTIHYHNFYAFANLQENNINAPFKWMSLSGNEGKINILSEEKAPYPNHIEFNSEEFLAKTESAGFSDYVKKYLRQIGKLGKVEKGAVARKVTYEFESEIYTCMSDKENFNAFDKLKVVQPYDPYLAYFIVPQEQRIKIRNEGRNAEGIFNPCINPEGISASGFSPFGFSDYWRPFAQGHSADKTPFDCSLFYQEGKSIQVTKVEYTENIPKKTAYIDFGHFENFNRPIRASFLFGSQETMMFEKFDTAEAKRLVELYLSPIDTKAARENLPSFQKKFDANFSRLLLLLWNVSKHMDFVKTDIEAEELSIKVVLKGKLKLSKKDLELTYYFSPNNPQYPGADFFHEAVAQEFLKSDIFIYEGHSAGGSVFASGFDQLRKNKDNLQNKDIKYQIVALYACSSGVYFFHEQFPRVDADKFRRHIIRTAGGYLDHTGNGSLALIASLDAYLYNQSYVPFGFWAQNFKSDNFYILSDHAY